MKKYLFFLLMAMPLSFASCSSDDESTVSEQMLSKSELIGTWYALDDPRLIEIEEYRIQYYELWYNLNKDGKYFSIRKDAFKYEIIDNKMVLENGVSYTVDVKGNTLKLTNGNSKVTLTYTKFNGLPHELIEHLNKE